MFVADVTARRAKQFLMGGKLGNYLIVFFFGGGSIAAAAHAHSY